MNSNNQLIADKSKALSKKMNDITAKFSENLDCADDLLLTSDEVVSHANVVVNTNISNAECVPTELFGLSATEVINLNIMTQDFKYVRDVLKSNTENAKRVLNIITLKLLEDENATPTMVTSFAELNRSITDNMKLYVQAYKEISNVLININKIKDAPSTEKRKDNKTIIATIDLLNTL